MFLNLNIHFSTCRHVWKPVSIANNDQIPFLQHLIWVCSVCSGLFVWIFRINTVLFIQNLCVFFQPDMKLSMYIFFPTRYENKWWGDFVFLPIRRDMMMLCMRNLFQILRKYFRIILLPKISFKTIFWLKPSYQQTGLKVKWMCFRNIPLIKAHISLMLSTLGKIFSRWLIEIFFLFFRENRIWHFMQIVSSGDNLHEMSNHVFSEK